MQTDRPIETATQDRFDRAPFARRIAEVIRERKDPSTLVMAIYGPWGDGKSSTISLIKEAIAAKTRSVVIVDYNPWLFNGSTESLTRSLFLSLGEALEKAGIFSKEKIGKLLSDYGSAIPKVGLLVKTWGEKLSVSDLKETRKKVEGILLKHKTPIAVFVDDIDRLDRTEIQTLFKLIRLSADFPYVVYVLAFDDEIVAAALGEAYESGDAAAGRRFLEKIVQAPLHLPRANPDILRKLVFEAVDGVLKTNAVELSQQQAHSFGNNFAFGLTSFLTTPRQVKLYENAITFAVPLLAAETNVVDLLLLEAVRTFVPKLYLSIRDNPDLFLKGLGSDKAAEKLFNDLMTGATSGLGMNEAQQEGLKTWVIEKLFPRISSMGYGNEWNAIWAKDKHICVSDYFSRYFSYGVPTGDIADALIDRLIAAGAASDATEMADCFGEVVRQAAYTPFIRKLRTIEDRIPIAAVPSLIAAMAISAKHIPRERGMGIDFAVMQSAILTSHLTQKFEDKDARFAIMKSTFDSASSFPYMFELLRFTRETEEKGERHGFLNEPEIKELADVFAKRLIAEADGQPLYRFLGEDTRSVLLAWIWYGDAESLRENISTSLKTEGVDGAEALLEVVAGKSWDMTTGVPDVADIRTDGFDMIKKLVDVDFLFSLLSDRYAKDLENPEYRMGSDAPIGKRLAVQFAYLRKKAIESPPAPAPDSATPGPD